MATKKTHKKRKRGKERIHILIEYYTHYFQYLHSELSKTDIDFRSFPDECKSFWNVVPPGAYSPTEALDLLSQYLVVLEDRIAVRIRKQSIGYWLHLYRRLSPSAIGLNDDPATILNVRSTVEAAFQKYARIEICDKIAFSNEVDISEVLRGFLLSPTLDSVREYLIGRPQFVLTDFGLEDLIELYKVEQIGYEIWRAMATKRTIGKGANLSAIGEEPFYLDTRDDELSFLLSFYDERMQGHNVSMNGVIFDSKPFSANAGFFLIPQYNVTHSTVEPYLEALRVLNLRLPDSFQPNFVLGPYPFKEYFENHSYYAPAFGKEHRIELIHIMHFLGSLLYSLFFQFQEDKLSVLKMLQRAYEGPYSRAFILEGVSLYLKPSARYLGLNEGESKINIEQIFNFFSINENERSAIDISLGGPMKIFIPVRKDRFFIDYAWLGKILYTLFWKINPSDQNFKGLALEKLINNKRSVLPTKPCKSVKGTSKQIDASYEMGEYLFILECRAKGKSFALEKGDIQAIQMRQRFIAKSLIDVDEKARWLVDNPIGRNYDISKYKGIIPVLVSPFTEFIPSRREYYWLTENISRVMTPSEFDNFISTPLSNEKIALLYNIYWNVSRLTITS